MGAARMLVVDDIEAVRNVTIEMLQRGDYIVESAASGREALDLLKSSAAFDLILLDVGMPELSGVEVYQRIRRDSPEQKILFMTGYAEGDVTDLENPHTFLLSKPFSLKLLQQTVSSIIE